jgi:hypothetical protein
VQQSGYAYGGSSNDGKMVFHKVDDTANPGVGEYEVGTSALNVRKSSPKATIGNQSRFAKACSLNDFIGNLPEQYVRNHSKVRAKPVPLGTFTNERRWNESQTGPGVGDYDLTGFKNFAKASETVFEIPKKSLNNSGSKRAKSAIQRSDMRSTLSKSPKNMNINQSVLSRKLGGPQNHNTNFIMQASRFQRTLLFVKENESALLNKLGQGPAAYDTQRFDKDTFGKKYQFSIPRVSYHRFSNCFIDRQKSAPVPQQREESSDLSL